MVEVYSLTEVKRSKLASLSSIFLLALALGILVFSFLARSLTFFVLFVLVAGGWYYAKQQQNIEYEVSYFDGEFRFAKIMNKSRRKKLDTFTMEEVMQLAPSDDRSVSNYLRDNGVKKVNMTSCTDAPYYVLVRRTTEKTVVYMIELDDKFLDEVCKKNASKVIRKR